MNCYKKNLVSGFALMLASLFLFGFTKDTARLHVIAVKKVADLHAIFKYSGQRAPFISAHRGGSLPGFPENSMATYENTLKNTYAIIELDPRYTKDSAMVIHHDPTLRRTTEGNGNVIDYTLAELLKLRLKDSKGNLTDYHMPTFDEVLEWAKGRTILVIDQKDVSAKDRLRKAEEHNCVQNVILIVYSFNDAKLCYSLNKNVVMEVMIPSPEKVLEFDKTGVPWKNVVAFVGHNLPDSPELYKMIHERGALCMAGSSRNVDLKFLRNQVTDFGTLKDEYMDFFAKGIDLIETDVPVYLGPLVNPSVPAQNPVKKYFMEKSF
ncbi:MAG TPA: glycerophosphodiester phosphodiesterase family protein [Bacteroidales bacterium]|jgi:glycerophosphoryl diester phosphodiesterase|nr:glycerophosphodiester phosphodiesterase family protein [Bacteroidales bacterium]